MPLGVKVGPFIAMKGPRKPDDPGFFGVLFLFAQLVVMLVVVVIGLLAGLVVLAWRGAVIMWIFVRHGRSPQRRPRTVYYGKQDRIGWRCQHGHATLAEAKACTAAYKLTDEYREKVAALAPSKWPAAPDLSGHLAQLTELHTSGHLSDDEFAAAKGRLLGASTATPS